MKYSNDVQEWIAQWSMDAFQSINHDPGNFELYFSRRTISISYWGNDPTYKKRCHPVGTATCAPSDDFDFHTGVAIAWARLLNLPIPKELLTPPNFNAFSLTIGATFSLVSAYPKNEMVLYKVLDYTTVDGTRSLFCKQVNGHPLYPYVSFVFRREENLRVVLH